MKTEFLRETLVRKSLARREWRREFGGILNSASIYTFSIPDKVEIFDGSRYLGGTKDANGDRVATVTQFGVANTTYNDGQGQGWITVVTNTEIKNNVTIVSESPKTYIDFYGNEAISSSTIFTVKIKYNKYKRVKKKRK